MIRGSADLLRRDNLSAEKWTRYLDAISTTAERAAKLTGQLLAFARRQSLKPEVFDARSRLGSVAEMPAIRGHAGAPGPFVAVALTDTGGGIALEDQARIFEPFFTTKEVGKGTGLELSQVFGFAKQSGGDVAVESAPGRTTFTLFLPQARPDELPGDQLNADETEAEGKGLCVLVVEDNIEVGPFSTEMLEEFGYGTVWVSSAEEALDRLGDDGNGFDVVFSDVVMPGMGGIELARLLKRKLPDMPVILASGYSHVLAQEGTYGFELVQKPYSAEEVTRVLRKAVGG